MTPPKTWSAEPIRLHELLSCSSSRHMVSRVAHGANVTPPLQVRTCLEHLRSVRNKCVKSLRFLPQDHIRIGPKKKTLLALENIIQVGSWFPPLLRLSLLLILASESSLSMWALLDISLEPMLHSLTYSYPRFLCKKMELS